MPLHLSALRSMQTSVVMGTSRSNPPPTKTAAVEAALATKSTQPVILLARPFAPGNIGAVARAMLNFGMSDLRLVAPLTQPWLTDEAQARACGAAPLLDEAQTFTDMPAATDDLQLVLATTARPRDANVPVLTPRAAAELAAEAIASGQRVGLLFGSEKNGLLNEELLCANRLVTVPTNPQFSSLNLAQAVLLICYEYAAAAAALREAEPERRTGYGERESKWGEGPAPMGMVRSLLDAWEDGLWRHGFFGERREVVPALEAGEELRAAATDQERMRAKAAMDKLRRMFVRSSPTESEASLLRGSLEALMKTYNSNDKRK